MSSSGAIGRMEVATTSPGMTSAIQALADARAFWPTAPSAVLRDGSATASWSYDALTLELTLVETDGAQHAWLVQP